MISEKILSYSDFMNMTYRDFKRIEATYIFMMNIKNGNSTNKEETKDKVKEKLSGLSTISQEDFDNLPDEYKEIF